MADHGPGPPSIYARAAGEVGATAWLHETEVRAGAGGCVSSGVAWRIIPTVRLQPQSKMICHYDVDSMSTNPSILDVKSANYRRFNVESTSKIFGSRFSKIIEL